MDGGPLPSRLSEVLADMEVVLQSADGAWNEAATGLRKSLRKLRRRCIESVADTVMVGTEDAIAEAELQAEQDEVVQVGEADDSASPGTSDQADQHLMLFRKMNEWGFLDDAQKMERLQQAEEAARRPRRSLSQEELTDVVNMAAACLAAPRRKAALQDADSGCSGEASAAVECQGTHPDLQRRVRSLLLHALKVWRMNEFDCHAIEHVLELLQRKISKFEDKVGEIQSCCCWQRLAKNQEHGRKDAAARRGAIEPACAWHRSPDSSCASRQAYSGAPERHRAHCLESGYEFLEMPLLYRQHQRRT